MMTPHEHRRLLLVEPHPAAESIRRNAADAGWVVDNAAGILRALRHAAAIQTDAVILHHSGTVEDGIAAEEFRRLGPGIRVMATAECPKHLPWADDIIIIPCDPRRLRRYFEDAIIRVRNDAKLAELEKERRMLAVELDRRGRRIATMEAAWDLVNRSLCDLNALLDASIELFRQAAGAERLSLMLIDERREMRILAARGVPLEIMAGARVRLGEGVAGWVARHGRPLLASGGQWLSAGTVGKRAYRNDFFLSLPLKTERETLGVVNITDRPESRPFDEEEIRRLEYLANQTALWITHSRRIQSAEKMCLVDELTGLYNRRYLMREMLREIDRARRNSRRFSLAMVDIDHFKLYNDRRGHQAGDELLRQLAVVLQKNLRFADMVCRYGGEEFAIILPGTGSGRQPKDAEGAHFIDRLRRVISMFPFMGLDTMPDRRMTVSAGVSEYPRDGETAEELIRIADERLYAAKSTGRNKVVAGPAVETGKTASHFPAERRSRKRKD